MNRFLIACGGTGGHLSPGIALAEELLARGHSCTLLVSRKQVDTRLASKYRHLEFLPMPGAGFSLRPMQFLRFIGGLLRGIFFVSRLIRRLRPDVVIGFGGFTTAALALAARLHPLGPLVVLHEANRIPGRAIRLAGSLAHRVYLPPGVRRSSLSDSVLQYCGLPVRRELTRVPRTEARRIFGLDPERKTLLILGGSQGARPLNEWVTDNLPKLTNEGIQVLCVSGPSRGSVGTIEHTAPDGSAITHVFLPFCDNMAALLSAADLVVSRAGAGTLAELVHLQLPAILVPFPHAADDHQTHNARYFERQGGGFVLDQEFLRNLTNEAREVIFNDWLLQQFRHNLHRMRRQNSAVFISDDLEHLLDDTTVRVRPSATVVA